MLESLSSFTLLEGVTENTEGVGANVDRFRRFSIHLHAADITTGGTLRVEALSPLGHWSEVHSRAVVEDEDKIVQALGPILQLRGIVEDYVDGTYSISVHAIV